MRLPRGGTGATRSYGLDGTERAWVVWALRGGELGSASSATLSARRAPAQGAVPTQDVARRATGRSASTAMATELPTLPSSAPPAAAAAPDRAALVRRARVLAWAGVGWHAIEASVAIGAGAAAGSIALVGFGADSLIESLAGFVVLWR